MSLLDKEPVKRVEKVLRGFDHRMNVLILEESARTALDAASSLKCDSGAIVKSLLFKVESNFVLCLVSGDKRCSLDKLKKILNIKNIAMASPEEVKINTGYTIGGVSPVGHINKIQILIDNSLERFIDLYAAAGHPNCIFKINFKNLQKITSGTVKNLIE